MRVLFPVVTIAMTLSLFACSEPPPGPRDRQERRDTQDPQDPPGRSTGGGGTTRTCGGARSFRAKRRGRPSRASGGGRPTRATGRSWEPGTGGAGRPTRRAGRPRPGGAPGTGGPARRTRSFWRVPHRDRDQIRYLQRKRSARVAGLLQRRAGWAQMSARSNRHRNVRAEINHSRSPAITGCTGAVSIRAEDRNPNRKRFPPPAPYRPAWIDLVGRSESRWCPTGLAGSARHRLRRHRRQARSRADGACVWNAMERVLSYFARDRGEQVNYEYSALVRVPSRSTAGSSTYSSADLNPMPR